MLLPPVDGCASVEASQSPTFLTTHQALQGQQPHIAAELVNPRTPLRVGIHCRVFPRLRVVPFLGLAVVHRLGALGVACSI